MRSGFWIMLFQKSLVGDISPRTAIVWYLFKIKNNQPEFWRIFHLMNALQPPGQQTIHMMIWSQIISMHQSNMLSLPFICIFNIKSYYDFILILHIIFKVFMIKYLKYLIIIDFVSNYFVCIIKILNFLVSSEFTKGQQKFN